MIVEQINCPQCQKRLLIAKEGTVRECQCPSCGGVFRAAQVDEGGAILLFPVKNNRELRQSSEDEGVQPQHDSDHQAPESEDRDSSLDIRYLNLQFDAPQREPVSSRLAWLPVGRIGFAAGALLALLVPMMRREPTASRETDLFAIPAFGMFYGLLAFTIAWIYRNAPRDGRFFIHLSLASVLVLDVLYLWLNTGNGKSIHYEQLFFGTIFGFMLTGMTILFLGFISSLLQEFRRYRGEEPESGSRLYDPPPPPAACRPEDDPYWRKP
jgi:hypothetical protein